MQYILYNPKNKDIVDIKKRGIHKKKVLIINIKNPISTEIYEGFNSINFWDILHYNKINTRSWLQRWSYTKIDEKTIKEVFSYQDQTIFYLLSYFFLRRLRAFKKTVGLNFIFALIDIFKEFVKEDVSVISYDPNGDYFIKILKKVCEKKKVHLTVIKDKDTRSSMFDLLINNRIMIMNMAKIRINSRYIIGKIRKICGLVNYKKEDILFLSNTRFSRKKEEDNVMFGTLITELNKGGLSNKTINYAVPENIEYLKNIIKHYTFIRTNYIGDYYSLRLITENNRLFKRYQKEWQNIRNHKNIKESCIYKDINFYDLAKPIFDTIFNSINYLIVDNLNTTKEILKKEKPKIVIIDHEDNFYGKGIMINAKNTNVKTIALQHEVIEPMDVNHSHIKDKKVLDKKSIFWRPLPNKKCVWATYSKKVLLNLCNYSKEKIIITGNPKFDSLIKNKYDKKTIMNKYGLSKNSKFVLYATEYMEDAEFVLKETRNMKDVVFLLKPHPMEDFNFYKNLKKKYYNKNLILFPSNTNIYELISISDIVITKTSTVGIEAMIKGVPVIIFDPRNSPDPWEYAKSGSALKAHDGKELTKCIYSILRNPKVKKRLDKKMKRYVYSRTHKSDGKATERVCNVIKKLLKESD